MKYALEVLQGHMVCGAREGRAALALTKWILAPKSLQMVIAAIKLKDGYSLEEKL